MEKRLYRSCKDVMLGGVAGGVAEYFGIDPTLVRLLMALVFLSGFGFLAYIFAWIIIPLDPSCKSTKTAADEIKEKAETAAKEIKDTFSDVDVKASNKNSEISLWVGLMIILFGITLLLQNLLGFDLWHSLWPVLLILAGLMILTGGFKKK